MNRYPVWKNLLVVLVVLVGALFALPNIYDQDPSIEITGLRQVQVDAATESRVRDSLDGAGIPYKGFACWCAFRARGPSSRPRTPCRPPSATISPAP